MLYEIIKKKNLKELGFNIDIPSNIINKDKYMNALFKFILNIFFYISKNKIKKFCLLSPNTLMDFRMVPVFRNLITMIDLSGTVPKYYYHTITSADVTAKTTELNNVGEASYDLSMFEAMGAISSGVYYNDNGISSKISNKNGSSRYIKRNKKK